jgi:hypothetical protein
MTEQFETCSKKTRGMAKASLDLIEKMSVIAEEAQPITGRGVGYKLFTAGLIPSMSRSDMQRVYRLLKLAREDGTIAWHWIVDEAREFERTPTWNDPEEYAEATIRDYRRDFWKQQPRRCEGGLRKARYAACWLRCSTSMPSASGSCTASLRQPSFTTLQTMTTADCCTHSMLAIGTLVVCTCRNVTCRIGWKSMTAITSLFIELL